MSAYKDHGFREEVYIERRHSESPNRYAQAPYTPGPYTTRRESTPHFNAINYGEPERGRSISSRSGSRRGSEQDEQMIRYESYSRAKSVDSSRRRSSSRHGSASSQSVSHYAGPDSPGFQETRRRSSSRKSIVRHPVLDNPSFTPEEEEARRKKARNKQLLYTGLAAITTIAATNNVYQSTKQHKARKEAVREGYMYESDAKRERNKAIAMDILSVGVGAICVNNAVNGWKKSKAMKAEEEVRRSHWDSHLREERRRSMVAY
jgi:hypothetical protein